MNHLTRFSQCSRLFFGLFCLMIVKMFGSTANVFTLCSLFARHGRLLGKLFKMLSMRMKKMKVEETK